MKLSDQPKRLVKILYIEDAQFYTKNLIKYLVENPLPGCTVEITNANCLEVAHHWLKEQKFDGIIADLQIEHCSLAIRDKYDEERMDLKQYSPAHFFGLGLLLSMQAASNWIEKTPKLIFSEYEFSFYKNYFEKLRGNLNKYERKVISQQVCNEILYKWIEENFKCYETTNDNGSTGLL